ncbi:VPLPA-CTERM sorting domain-containing protein [Sulfurirhabdus autotrophica]|uniref:Putative secreted protein n=1 Tax=Sulfurirhabdus autotrophica TaxID=1706046 RepID=A0A4R3YEY3_9PROT|nr:VPLPA-CTERM sorting domain-containing protein [Sulfurirhabdus autotrophica]TCV90650.1 putative secreted protein [Sulfurirhabdus autotrophica]
MRLIKIPGGMLVVLLALGSQSVLANNISSTMLDNKPLDVSLYSSDGLGNFQIKIDEYMSAYGEQWNGDVSGPGAVGFWNALSTSPNLSISFSGASVSGNNAPILSYQGIVDASKVMFSSSATQWANNFDSNDWATDSGMYSVIASYSISGFTPGQAYSITAVVDDCCIDQDPSLGMTQHATAHITFSPSVSAVPVPAAAWLLGSGLIGLIGVARRSNI